ncbi:MAG: hypothetical protein ABSG51_15800 [Terracidiphilus sp.]|jgi:hypothetical protein
MSPLSWILQAVFGCHHNHLTRVFTIKQRTYQVCIECGREFGYSWELMQSTRSSAADDAYVPLHGMLRPEADAI